LRGQNASTKRLLPVHELLTHIREVRQFYAALVRSEKLNDVRALGRGIFARSIEERLRMAGVEMEPMRRSAQSHALAGSFFSLLDWWINTGMKEDRKKMDDLFHRLAWSGLAAHRK